MARTLFGIFAGVIIGATLMAGVSIVRGQSDPGGGGRLVPDMEAVYRSALTNLFEAGGEQFTDPELKAFYDRLTKDITDSLDKEVDYDPGVSAE